jgi:hypothetical protein
VWKDVTYDWTYAISLIATKNDKGFPALSVQQSGSPDVKPTESSGSNDCAKVWKVIGDILDGLLSGLTLGMTNIFGAGGLFGDLINPRVPSLDNVGGGFTNISSMVSACVILPAGKFFSLRRWRLCFLFTSICLLEVLSALD